MRRDRIPIIEIHGQLLASLQRELSDVDAVNLQDDILTRLRETGRKGLILDVTGVEVVDSYIARVFNDIASAARAMGAQTVLVGLRPAVAMTLVEMDVVLAQLRTSMTLDRALEMLEEARGEKAPARPKDSARPKAAGGAAAALRKGSAGDGDHRQG